MRRLIDVGQNNEYRCHSMANKWIFTETQIHWNGFIFLSKKNKIPFRSIIYVKPKIGFSPHSLIRFIRKKFTRTNEVQFIFVKCLTSFFYGFQQRINSKFSTHISRPLHKNGGKKMKCDAWLYTLYNSFLKMSSFNKTKKNRDKLTHTHICPFEMVC